jgi:glycogen debranching enzyme
MFNHTILPFLKSCEVFPVLDYQLVAADRNETLVLGKLFVIFFMGEAGPGVPYTGIYFDDMRYIDFYALRHNDSLTSPSKVEKGGSYLKYHYTNIEGNTTRTVRLFYDGIEEEIWSDSPEKVRLEIKPTFSDIFFVRELVSGSGNEKRWDFKQKTNFKKAKNLCQIDYETARGSPFKIFVHSGGITRKEGKLLVAPKKKHSKIWISINKRKVTRNFGPTSVYESFPNVSCDNSLLSSLYSDSVVNLSNTLDAPNKNSFFPLGPVPWYHAIFGRDSTMTALHSLLFNPQIARSTIVTLGNLIGKKFDGTTEEEPGKIIHEKRFGVVSGRKPPLSGYYGSVDATPLYVLTYVEYVKHHPEDKTITSFQDTVLKALRWIRNKIANEDLLGYTGRTTRVHRSQLGYAGLSNQGWKDSWDSVSHADGSLPPHPLYLIEVQGYAAKALEQGSVLARNDLEKAEMKSLSKKLIESIERRYWSNKTRYFGEAIDGNGRLTEIITSNPSHLLWMRVLKKEEARKIAKVLVDRALLNSGYGIKTLSYNEVRHDPLSYHNGSVWPHDNMIALSGLANYGLVSEFSLLFSELLGAYNATSLKGLPELFSGERAESIKRLDPMGGFPIPWSDAGICGIIHSMLGLRIDCDNEEDRMSLMLSPMIPSWLNSLSVKGLYIIGGKMNIRLRRRGESIDVNYSFPSEPRKNVKVEIYQ